MLRHASYATKSTFFSPSSNYTSAKTWRYDPCLKVFSMSLSVSNMASCETHLDSIAYADLVKKSGDLKTLVDGMCIHDHIIRHLNLVDSMYIDGLLVQMYANCGLLDDAAVVFMKTRQRSASIWNFLIKAYVAQGNKYKAFKLFEQMQLEKVLPSKFTIIRLLSTCCCKLDLENGRKLHEYTRLTELKVDVFVGTALVSMYGKCGDVEDAWKSFHEMPRKDVVSYSVMIGVCARCGRGFDALQLLHSMEKEGIKPDSATFVCALNACNNPTFLEEGEKLHDLIKQNGCELNVTLATALVTMYGKCGSVHTAHKVFDEIPEPNLVSWNSMLAVYVRHNQGKEAIRMMEKMRHHGVKPDRVTFVSIIDACTKHSLLAEGERMHDLIWDHGLEGDGVLKNALLNMYGKCGNLERATVMFKGMQDRDAVSWNTMIALHVQHDRGHDALELLHQMQQEGVTADGVTFASTVDACGSCLALFEGKKLHSCLARSELELDDFVTSTLVNMYRKCGNPKEARILFDTMLERDVVTWNTMLTLHAQHETGGDAFGLFAQMKVEGVKPDNVTLTCLLDACGSSGLLSEGEKLHVVMVDAGYGYHFDTTVGTALIYMYGKCGNLRGAVRVFDRIYDRDVVAWTAMIAMYAQHGEAEDAVYQFLEMQGKGMKPDCVTFVSILTACTYSGFFDVALFCFAYMILSHAVSPSMEHYVCLVDLFGRAGRLIEAEIILDCMPSDTSAARFFSFLGACRYHIDVDRGERAAKHVLEMDVDGVSSYVTLSNIYAAACSSYEHME